MSITEAIQEYRIVVRPSLLRNGKFCAEIQRRVSSDGSRIEVWPQTHFEADTLEGAVMGCVEKCKEFVVSQEYRDATGY